MDNINYYIKNGWELSKNAYKIMKLVINNDGYCLCQSNQHEGENRKCPCKDYLEKDVCHCNMYIKKENDE